MGGKEGGKKKGRGSGKSIAWNGPAEGSGRELATVRKKRSLEPVESGPEMKYSRTWEN